MNNKATERLQAQTPERRFLRVLEDEIVTPAVTLMEIPANSPSVIGVAASNTERKRGPFSNEGI